MNVGDIVKFRSGKRFVIGKVVRKPDAMNRLCVEVEIAPARPQVARVTLHVDDAEVVRP